MGHVTLTNLIGGVISSISRHGAGNSDENVTLAGTDQIKYS